MRSPLRVIAARVFIRCWIEWHYLLLAIRLARYGRDQEGLGRRYGVEGHEPESYTDSTRERILKHAATFRGQREFAWTSGTTHQPKQILYPRRRIRALQQLYVVQAILAYRDAGLGRPAFYFLTSMAPDRSVSGLLAREPLPWWLARYILCDSVVYESAVARLINRYPQEALHLTLLMLTAPVLIAMANPSSLYVIIERAQQGWNRIRAQVQDILAEDGLSELRRRGRRTISRREVMVRQLLGSPRCPTVKALLPELKMVYCWQGGYVQPFLDNLQQQLGDLQPIFRPMFSMSTETVAYLIYPRISTDAGLPIYPGVCYEFMEADDASSPRHLLRPWELQVGQQYLMVVSDAYGLRRYQTNDVFECVGVRCQTPLLRFLRRAGLSYSFTGEKITDQQLLEVYETVQKTAKLPGAVFVCFPRLNKGKVPGYVFVRVVDAETVPPDAVLSQRFDEALMRVNEEYASKRKSGRLAQPEMVSCRYEELVAKLMRSDARYRTTSPAQFKLLPLYQTAWETLGE